MEEVSVEWNSVRVDEAKMAFNTPQAAFLCSFLQIAAACLGMLSPFMCPWQPLIGCSFGIKERWLLSSSVEPPHHFRSPPLLVNGFCLLIELSRFSWHSIVQLCFIQYYINYSMLVYGIQYHVRQNLTVVCFYFESFTVNFRFSYWRLDGGCRPPHALHTFNVGLITTSVCRVCTCIES